MLDACQGIERELGRNRAAEAIEKASSGAAYSSRPIDIDIIFYGDEVIDDERLTVPHPLLCRTGVRIAAARGRSCAGTAIPSRESPSGEMLDALRNR